MEERRRSQATPEERRQNFRSNVSSILAAMRNEAMAVWLEQPTGPETELVELLAQWEAGAVTNDELQNQIRRIRTVHARIVRDNVRGTTREDVAAQVLQSLGWAVANVAQSNFSVARSIVGEALVGLDALAGRHDGSRGEP